jgi:hypothetical protein
MVEDARSEAEQAARAIVEAAKTIVSMRAETATAAGLADEFDQDLEYDEALVRVIAVELQKASAATDFSERKRQPNTEISTTSRTAVNVRGSRVETPSDADPLSPSS